MIKFHSQLLKILLNKTKSEQLLSSQYNITPFQWQYIQIHEKFLALNPNTNPMTSSFGLQHDPTSNLDIKTIFDGQGQLQQYPHWSVEEVMCAAFVNQND